ncbi:MAG: DUF1080 domain-containing protein [Candidatus Hinthialibacter antarcticus]|nr:DUF1080 domain-containing protein [Candidatus Hinthialibacter antarcticus]
MKCKSLTGLAFAVLFACAATIAAPQEMFNGKDLTGWTPIGGGKWTAEKGEIVGKTGDGAYGWLLSDKDYANFILEFDVKTEAKGNSGLQIRSHVVEGQMHGYQVEIDPTVGMHSGGIYDEHGRGWLAQPTADGEKAWNPDGWNHYRVEAIDETMKVFINGKQIVEVKDDNARSGVIALQVHSGDNPPVHVRFKNVKIDDKGLGEGWTPLFDGKTLNGWENIGIEEWSVVDGAILGMAVTDAYGYLATEKTFKDVEVSVYYLAESSGNSGLFYHSTFKGVDVSGVQAEIDPNPGNHTGGLYESAGRGWLVQPNELAEKVIKPIGKWNHLLLKVKGKHVQTWTNGLKSVDYINETPKYFDGVVALQLHSGGAAGVRFKGLQYRIPE